MTQHSRRSGSTWAIASMRMLVPTTATALVVAGVAACGSRSRAGRGDLPAGFPSEVSVSGQRAPFVGLVPWSNAVAAGADALSVTVEAGRVTASGKPPCGADATRARVVSDKDSGVVIAVAAYAIPRTSNVCTAVGYSPDRVSVDLHAPLGSRPLRDDSDERVHRVLLAATAPALRPVPNDYRSAELSWDERTGVVTRRYTSISKPSETWILHAGPTDKITSRGDSTRPVVRTATIGLRACTVRLLVSQPIKADGGSVLCIAPGTDPSFYLERNLVEPDEPTPQALLDAAKSVETG